MKLRFPCMACTFSSRPGTHPLAEARELREDGRYEFTCMNGHKSIVIIQQMKFEILFEYGLNAYLDSYYREAVTSFASSLERFYEFAIKVILTAKGCDNEINSAWKLVKAQSERQLGGYIFLYLSEVGKPPVVLNSTQVRFRNSVVHGGLIPSPKETMNFGQVVLDIIRPTIMVLQERFPEAISKIVFEHLVSARKPDDGQVGTMSIATALSLNVAEPGHHDRPMEVILEHVRKWKSMMG